MTAIDYLILGHVAHDKTAHGPQLGGTVAYGALTAQGLGLRVGVVTSAHPGDPVLAALDTAGITVHLLPAAQSTVFVNTYTPAGRVQTIESRARVLTYDDIPPAWRDAPIVHLGPIAQELDAALTPDRFPTALVGVTPQGYMRAWDGAAGHDSGRIRAIPWAAAGDVLPSPAVVVLSEEDLGKSAALEREYADQAARLVVTRADHGATLYRHGTRQDIPAPPIDTVTHPTGAGDVFAAALLAALHRRPDAWEDAMRAAVTLATVFVERCQSPGAPTRDCMAGIVGDARVAAVYEGVSP